MLPREIQEHLDKVLGMRDCIDKLRILDSLAGEDPENTDVQTAQVELGRLYYEGRSGAPRDHERAEQILQNPAKHNNSNALLYLGLIQYGRGKMDAMVFFVRAWITGGHGAEAAVAKLEELRKSGLKTPQFLEVIDGMISQGSGLIEERIRVREDGSAYLAKALYYIYELGGTDAGNLKMAHECLKKALEKEYLLARIYLKRTAFAHMDVPGASARLADASRDYTPKPEISPEQAYQDYLDNLPADPYENLQYPSSSQESQGLSGGGREDLDLGLERTMTLRDLPAYLYFGTTGYSRSNNFGWGVEYVNDSDSNDRITITNIHSSSPGQVNTNAGTFYFN